MPQRGIKNSFMKERGYLCHINIENIWNNQYGAQGKKYYRSISIFHSSVFQFLHSIVFPQHAGVQDNCCLGEQFDMLFWVLSSQHCSPLKEEIVTILVAPEKEIQFFLCTIKSKKFSHISFLFTVWYEHTNRFLWGNKTEKWKK